MSETASTPKVITNEAFKVSKERLAEKMANDPSCKAILARIEKYDARYKETRRKMIKRLTDRRNKTVGRWLAKLGKRRRHLRSVERNRLINAARKEFNGQALERGLTPQ